MDRGCQKGVRGRVTTEHKETPTGQQGDAISLVLKPWAPLNQDQVARERIAQMLDRGAKYQVDKQRRWRWWELRQHLGGAVDTVRFRRLVDELAAQGLLLEVFEVAGKRLPPRHMLVLTERWNLYKWGELIEVRGREDVLRRLGILQQ